MIRRDKIYYWLHPITWYVIGFMTYMFIPPFFNGEGHNWEIIAVDFVAIISFSLMFKLKLPNLFKRYTANVDSKTKNDHLVIASFFLIIYIVRFYEFQLYGIYAFLHPYSRPSSLYGTLCNYLSWPYITFLISCLYCYPQNKWKYILLLILEVIIFVLPVMSKAYIFMFVVNFAFCHLYYKGMPRFKVKLIFVGLISTSLLFINYFGNHLGAIRSYAYINQIDKIKDIDFAAQEKGNVLMSRLNVHQMVFDFSEQAELMARLDKVALIGYLKYKIGIEDRLPIEDGKEIDPGGLSTYIGTQIGYSEKTATEIPRNYVLYHYDLGIVAVILFAIFLGLFANFIYRNIWAYGNTLFPMAWFSLIFGRVATSLSAFVSTFLFQSALLFSSFAILYLTYCVLKQLNRITFRKKCCVTLKLPI